MEINILHLYYDLMDLYGEYGNIKIIERHLKDQDISVNVDKLSINDDIDFSKYDFIYIGSGTEKNQLLVIEHLLKYKEDIIKAIENNVVILATGNAKELFGKSLLEVNGSEHEMLGVTQITAQRLNDRVCTDIIYDSKIIDAKVVGFINKMSVTKNNEYPLFNVLFGKGDNDEENTEGFKYKNLYGTYVIGPIFARNPKFLNQIINDILSNKSTRMELKDIEYPYEQKGYDIVLTELTNRMNENK